MKIIAKYFTTRGKYRVKNQDKLLINDKIISSTNNNRNYCTLSNKNFFAISDGMGGLEKGEKASEIILQTVKNNKNLIFPKTFNELIDKIYENLCNYANKNNLNRMGGTLAFIKLLDDKITLFNMGDTRIYKMASNELTLLSKDHSLAYEAYINKRVEFDSIRLHPKKNILTSCLINDKQSEYIYWTSTFKIEPNTIYLICSDGVWENFSENELKRILSYKRMGNIVRYLLNSKYSIARDNLSAILIKVEN